MTLAKYYIPPVNTFWAGRTDLPNESCFFQCVKLLNLNTPFTPTAKLTFAVIGFSCDEGIRRNFGRVGAAKGPLMLRQSLAKLAFPETDILFYDAGNIICSNGDLEGTQTALRDAVAMLLRYRIVPIILGGGHELAFGNYQAIAEAFPQDKLAIVNFDAHFDMRPLLPNQRGSSGTPFLQIAEAHEKNQRAFDYNCIGIQAMSNIALLFAKAKQHHVNFILADEIHQKGIKCIDPFIKRMLEDNQSLYTSICLDVFAAAFAPGVSAPQPFGLMPWQIIPSLRQLASSGKVRSYDIAELSPPFDIDERTAKLGAGLIYEIIHHHRTN